jgi:SPP1 gp7 family putative phage head morphogenesis protein
VLTGKSIPEVARDIGRVVKDKDAFRRAGKTIFKTAQRRATLIARTETLRAHNEGRKVFYRQVGITKVRWLIADDDRTCKICRPLDGKVFGIDEVEGPHPGCRCTTVAMAGTASSEWPTWEPRR